MAARKPLTVISGQLQQLPGGDTLNPGDLPLYQGATASAAGQAGAVPAAAAGQQLLPFLGSGTYGYQRSVDGAGVSGANFTLVQTSTNNKGLCITGFPPGGGNNDPSNGVYLRLNYNFVNPTNQQLVVGAINELGLASAAAFRLVFFSGTAALDAVSGDGLNRKPMKFGNEWADVGFGLDINASPAAKAHFGSEANKVSVLVRGATSQASDLQQWQNSGGTTLVSVGPSGQLTVNSTARVGNYTAATLPITGTAGRIAYCSDARWSGGIGCEVHDTGSYWATPDGCQASSAATAFVGTFTASAALDRTHETCFYNSSSAGTFTLPAVASSFGKLYNLKQLGTGTLSTAGGTVEGQSSISLVQGQSVTLICDGAVWRIV